MTFEAPSQLDLRILVVEDTTALAEVLVDQLEDCGCRAVGPAAHLDHGLALAQTEALDGALLDVNLNGRQSFPIADALSARSIPFAFLTGDGDTSITAKYAHVPRLHKPYACSDLERLLEARFKPS